MTTPTPNGRIYAHTSSRRNAMTDSNHPLTPSRELIQQWLDETDGVLGDFVQVFTTKAARWGADVELKACCKWAAEQDRGFDLELRAARRPKPPSLKEQALSALKRQAIRSAPSLIATEDCDLIRRALEGLPDD